MASDLESFVESVDRAFMQKDIDAIENYVSDLLKVTVHINGGVHVYDKQSYLSLLKGNWDKADSYMYRKLASEIDIVDADKAIIREKVLEKLIIGAELYTVHSNLVVEVQRIDGELYATQLNAESELQVGTAQ